MAALGVRARAVWRARPGVWVKENCRADQLGYHPGPDSELQVSQPQNLYQSNLFDPNLKYLHDTEQQQDNPEEVW